ncbi:DUF1289 domain-containing protein [Thioalkalivibrio sp. ALE16]
MESPCTKQCRLNAARSGCTGCGRTLDEIRDWRRMTPGQRRTIMKRLQVA